MSDKIAEIRDRVEQDVAKGPANEAISRVHKDRAFLLAKVDHQRAEFEKLRAEMLDLAEWCETEEPLSYKQLSYRLRAALEGKP
jgi:hypothetical protein